MTITVRHAGVGDEQALVDILLAFHRENFLSKHFPYALKKIIEAVRHGTERKGSIIGVIDAPDRNNHIAGTIALYLDQWWWSECYLLLPRWTYVRPEYRKLGCANKLQEFAENIRKHFQESAQYPLVLEQNFLEEVLGRTRLLDRFFQRYGRLIGGVYISGL
jgi:GNAT superfamily N-acetyltransferase